MIENAIPREKISFTKGRHKVLLVSPQAWDSIPVSKHNYAIELSELGNEVYFLNPPSRVSFFAQPYIKISEVRPRLRSVDYSFGFPHWLKFKARWLYDRIMSYQGRRLWYRCGKPDVVWDFDNTATFSNLRVFPATWRIFHPVDQLETRHVSSKYADIVLSVGQDILARVANGASKTHFVQHGLGRAYVKYAEEILSALGSNNLRFREQVTVGYVGNLASRAVDLQTIKRIVESNGKIQFEFIGPFDASSHCDRAKFENWVAFLRSAGNCRLHGRKSPEEIVEFARDIDAWLVCYDVKRDMNSCCNSHKILEYLATGKVIVSNRISSYDHLDLLVSPDSMTNESLPALFQSTISNLGFHNSLDNARRRIMYALSHTYRMQIARVENILAQNDR